MKFRHLIYLGLLPLLLTSAKPVKIACIGDSITYGIGVDDRENSGYTAVLGKMLGEGYEVVNFGAGGRTMLCKGDVPYILLNTGMSIDGGDLYSQVKAYLPDIVTIMLGSNDSKPQNWRYGDEFADDCRLMVRQLKALPSHPTIYLCLPPWVKSGGAGINDRTVSEQICPIIRQVASENGLEVIDTYSPLKGHPECYADGVHPNKDGAAVLAQTIFNAMETCADTGRQGKRVMFIGDSITDGDWGKADGTPCISRNPYDRNHVYGHGYQADIAIHYLTEYPQNRYKFYNRGISGDRVAGLVARWDDDVLAVHPDIISILIGVNDIGGGPFDAAEWEKNYRNILDRSRAFDPQIKFVLCVPFAANVGYIKANSLYDKHVECLKIEKEIISRLAAEYGAEVVPFDEVIARCIASDKSGNCKYWIWDGIHPTMPGHKMMAGEWIRRCDKLLR